LFIGVAWDYIAEPTEALALLDRLGGLLYGLVRPPEARELYVQGAVDRFDDGIIDVVPGFRCGCGFRCGYGCSHSHR